MSAVGSAEWVAERRTGLGGTDMPKILGVSRFGGPFDVYMDKMGLTAPLLETEPMRWGNILEEPVAREYALKSGRVVRRAAGFLRHPSATYLYANIDRWSDKKGTPRRVYEGKTSGEFSAKEFGEEGTDQVPSDYLVQSMHYLGVTGKDTCDLAVLIGGQKHRVYTIEREDELIRLMHEVAAKFWSDFEQGIPPDIDNSEGAAAFLAHTYRDNGQPLTMTPGLSALAMRYAALKALGKENEAETTLVGNQIRSLMGDFQVSEGDGVRVLYSERAGPTKVDWKTVLTAAKVPQPLIDAHTKVGDPTRALTVTMRGDI